MAARHVIHGGWSKGRKVTASFSNLFSRRTFVQGGASLAAAAIAIPRIARAEGPTEYRLRTAPGAARLAAGDGPPAATLSYNGAMPGPMLRFKQGEPVRVAVENGLDQDTTVHWHGIRLPNPMDGVANLTAGPQAA